MDARIGRANKIIVHTYYPEESRREDGSGQEEEPAREDES